MKLNKEWKMGDLKNKLKIVSGSTSKKPIDKLIFFDRIRIKIFAIQMIISWLMAPILGDASAEYFLLILFFSFLIYPCLELMMIETYIEWYLNINITSGHIWLNIFVIIDLILLYLLSKKISASEFALKIRYWHFLLTLPLVVIWWFIPHGDPNVIISASLEHGSTALILGTIYLTEAYASLIYTGFLFKRIYKEA